jgi:hypothetical protein
MVKAESVLTLASRLKYHSKQAQRRGDDDLTADFPYAVHICRRYAALAIAEEAAHESDSARREQLTQEAVFAWREGHHHG